MEGFNKSDWNDARGIAQMMRVNLFRPGHGKTTSQKRRARLNPQKLLQDKAIAIGNDIRGLIQDFTECRVAISRDSD